MTMVYRDIFVDYDHGIKVLAVYMYKEHTSTIADGRCPRIFFISFDKKEHSYMVDKWRKR